MSLLERVNERPRFPFPLPPKKTLKNCVKEEKEKNEERGKDEKIERNQGKKCKPLLDVSTMSC